MMLVNEQRRQRFTGLSLTVPLQGAEALDLTSFANAREDVATLQGGPRAYDNLENP